MCIAPSGWLPKLNYSESFIRSDNPVFIFGSLLTHHQQVPDVSVTLFGGQRREHRVVLDEGKLAAYNLSPLHAAVAIIRQLVPEALR